MSTAENEGTTPDVEAHGLENNINEAVVEDAEADVAAHGLIENVNETVVDDAAEARPTALPRT